MRLLGIVNVTADSFSDGGRYLAADAAVAHALRLVEDGAAVVDVGAESTRPEAEPVPAEEELRRLEPVVRALVEEGVEVSVDTWKPRVMERVLALGARWINDVRGLREPGAVEALRGSGARAIVMHSVSAGARAERVDAPPEGAVERVRAWLARRVDELERAGLERERLVLDPGMGFFLSSDPRTSFAVLAGLPRLRAELGLPLLVCTSRKHFLGAPTGRAVAERGPATLATELHAWRSGVDYVRTHDVRALADALAVLAAIERERA